MANRLSQESSPYLAQHAHNPVDWYPWGPEALEAARSRDVPILLSVGYSACHWCHVMERESFSDPEVAELMNRRFVNVKVDREERPDVDAIYMRAVQSLTGHGGWPLTVFLTPDGRPFYGGTYFPPAPRQGMPSFPQVLEAAARAWDERRDDVEGAAGEITRLLERASREPAGGDGAGAEALDASVVDQAASRLLRQVDPTHGGFGQAPKFPQPAVLEFLLAHHAGARADGKGGESSLDAAVHTLRKMARGGIRDHLAGGFHRYAVDARWLVPHFEKMLYDNALLAGAYLKAHQLTGDAEMEAVTRETLDYLLTDLRSPEGAFFAARDADSEGEEGRFYVWTRDEVEALLDPDAARLFCRAYDVSAGGNFEGRNILHLPHELDRVAEDEGLNRQELDRHLASAREALLEARAQREPPLRDSKILAGWNGLALRALAEAGAALGEPRYVDAARDGLAFLLDALRPGGRLLHQVPGADGRRIPAFLDDVAAVGHACLSLHEATLEPRWLREATALADEVEDRFREDGLLFDTPHDAERLVVRPREVMDQAVPSGTSLAAELFLRVGRLLDRDDRIDAARELVQDQLAALPRFPTGFGRLLMVARDLVNPSLEIAVMGVPERSGELAALLREAHRPFLPGRVISGLREAPDGDGGGDGDADLDTPLLEGRRPVDGRATAWVCRRYACQAPVTDPAALRDALEGTRTG